MTGPFPDLSAFTDVRAERLTLENMEKAGMIAMPIGAELPPDQQLSFNRACEAEYIRFVNIRNMPLNTPSGAGRAPCAAYILTPLGRARLNELRERERLSKLLGP